MYAIVKVGGKQYRVEEGDTLLVDRMPDDEGAKVALEPLLLVGDGDPVFEGDGLAKAKVEATVRAHVRGPKIHGLKFKPKRGYKVRYGARADLTRLEIASVGSGSRRAAAKPKAETAAEAKAAEKPAAPKKAAAKKPAAKKPTAKKPAAKKPAAKKPPAAKRPAKKEDTDGS